MFGLKMYGCGTWSINTYAEAVSFYDSCPVKRGHDYGDERPVKGKARSNMGVRIKNGCVIFRYHATDVVTWRPDNSYVIDTYTSNSTCTFADCFTPIGHRLVREGRALQVEGVYHPVVRSITVRQDGSVEHFYKGTHFYRNQVNRARAKEVLAETRYAEYRSWYEVTVPMIDRSHVRSWHGMSYEAIMESLSDMDKWYDLMMSYYGDPAKIRARIYEERSAEVYDIVFSDTLSSLSALSKWSVTCP
jgi:hypothetical protein